MTAMYHLPVLCPCVLVHVLLQWEDQEGAGKRDT